MNYRLTVKPSDTAVTIDAQQTVLEAALNAGHSLPYSCRGGTCGACLGELLDGEVAYPDGQRPPALSAAQHAAGKALFCQARPLSDLVIKARPIDAEGEQTLRILPCRVAELRRLAPDVMQVHLQLPARDRLAFVAGQYIDFLLRDGRRRSFSLANPPHADETLELHIRHVAGGRFSEFVFNELQEKALLRLQGPLGQFVLRHTRRCPIIMIAGGTGFAPLKAMLMDAFHRGIDRPIHLYWGARARRDLYLHDLPLHWAEQYATFRYTPVLSQPAVEDHWEGRCGWVHEAVAADYPDLSGFEVYMSGPPAMIQAATPKFQAQGLAPDHLFYDAFEPAGD